MFKILNSIAYGPHNTDTPYTWDPDSYGLAFVYHDDEAINELARVGLVKLRVGNKVVKKVVDRYYYSDNSRETDFTEIFLVTEFITMVGLAILRDHRKKGEGNVTR